MGLGLQHVMRQTLPSSGIPSKRGLREAPGQRHMFLALQLLRRPIDHRFTGRYVQTHVLLAVSMRRVQKKKMRTADLTISCRNDATELSRRTTGSCKGP